MFRKLIGARVGLAMMACGREARCQTGAWRGRLCLALFLFLLLTGLPRPAAATVFCYLEDLDLVQETPANDCNGHIVSPTEAEVIKQRRQAYVRRAYGISAKALAKSVGRLPESPVTPADLDQGRPAKMPASPIGAALDLLRSFEKTDP